MLFCIDPNFVHGAANQEEKYQAAYVDKCCFYFVDNSSHRQFL